VSKVSNKFLAQAPADTIKGNNTGSTANVIDMTVSQAQTLLSIPTASSPLPVSAGGSGDTSHTAYAVLCGGTTTTGAVQSIASVGTTGQVLTSNGASALPTFQTASGASLSSAYYTQITASSFVTDSGSGTTLNPMKWQNKVYDDFGTSFSSSTGRFTAPATGRYQFTVDAPVMSGFSRGNENFYMGVIINQSTPYYTYFGATLWSTTTSAAMGPSGTVVVAMNSGDTAEFILITDSGDTLTVSDGSSTRTFLQILRIK
jgi:hypothetical protein